MIEQAGGAPRFGFVVRARGNLADKADDAVGEVA